MLKRDVALIASLTIVSTLLVWLTFPLLRLINIGDGLLTVFANFDGPNYIVVAKTWYNQKLIASSFPQPPPINYYPAHLPAYPFLIRIFNIVFPSIWAMFLATLLSSILAVTIFYLILKKFKITTQPLWLSTIFLFLPARWLIVRSIGAPEPLFLFAILTSFYFFKSAFEKKQNCRFQSFLFAGLFGTLAQMTKTPAILLFISYIFLLIWQSLKTKRISWEAWPILLMPISIFFLFCFYAKQTGDFFAYFHSGDNLHLFFLPFRATITYGAWLGDFWKEEIIYIYIFGSLTVFSLFKQKRYDFGVFAVIFFTAILFVSHRDIARYILPLVPFTLIAFAPFLEKKEFKLTFFLVLIPVYLYAINFILHNTAPIADWTPYL